MTSKESNAYDCFGSDDEESGAEKSVPESCTEGKDMSKVDITGNETKNDDTRDPSCGILSFHPHTEKALLLTVKNQVETELEYFSIANDTCPIKKIDQKAGTVLKAIDKFCNERHWMMHMGPEKGGNIMINKALERCLSLYSKASLDAKLAGSYSRRKSRFIALEVGTYCGYSAIRIALRLRQESRLNPKFEFMFYSLEVNKQCADVARELIALAGLSDFVQVIVYDPSQESIMDVLNGTLLSNATRSLDQLDTFEGESNPPQVHFLLLDHDKDAYLSDLQLLEQAGYIHPLSVVCADNVVFAQIANYMNYTLQLQQQGIVSTQLLLSDIEYASTQEIDQYGSKHLRDGVEITTYMKHPKKSRS